MAEFAGSNRNLLTNQTNVILKMDGRDEIIVVTPADVPLLPEVGPIIKFDLCIKRYDDQLQFIDLHGVPRRTQSTRPIIFNRRTEFPATLAWTFLSDLLSSVALIPRNILDDIMLQIYNYMLMYFNPRATLLYFKADLTIKNVTTTVPSTPVHALLAERDLVLVNESMVVEFSEQEEPPVGDLPRQPRIRSAMDLKERYGFRLEKTAVSDDNLGDCVVCLEELLVPGKSSKTLLKMPCSHMFHCDCIHKWLKMSDSCPLCRSIIP